MRASGKLPFSYTLRRSARAKRVRLSIGRDGKVEVVLPRRVPKMVGEMMVRARSSWVVAKLSELEQVQKNIHPDIRDYSGEHYREHRAQAVEDITKRAQELALQHSFTPKRITIRNQKTKWGSCSRQGNLNFHYKLIFLEPELRDYVIVHELCHLRELNHSPRFWQEVENILPEYKKHRLALRKMGL